MPFRGRPRRPKRRNFRKRRGSLAVPAVRGMLSQAEDIHSFQVDFSTATAIPVITSTTGCKLLNACKAGTDIINRTGNAIDMLSINIHGTVYITGNTNTDGTDVSLMLVYDRSPNGAILDIVSTSAGNGVYLTPADAQGFCCVQRNWNTYDRFSVLWRRRFTLGPRSDTATQAMIGGPISLHFDIFKRLGRLRTVFYTAAAAGTIADIQAGSLYLLAGCDQVTGTPTIVGTSLLRFAP